MRQMILFKDMINARKNLAFIMFFFLTPRKNARLTLWRKQTGNYNTEGWCYHREGAINWWPTLWDDYSYYISGRS